MHNILVILSLSLFIIRPVEDTVDYVEINHYFDTNCKLVFDQAIFYEYDEIVDWHMVKDGREKLNGKELKADKKRWDNKFLNQLIDEKYEHELFYLKLMGMGLNKEIFRENYIGNNQIHLPPYTRKWIGSSFDNLQYWPGEPYSYILFVCTKGGPERIMKMYLRKGIIEHTYTFHDPEEVARKNFTEDRRRKFKRY